MKKRSKILIALIIAALTLILGVAIGSVYLPPSDIFSVLAHKIFGKALPEDFSAISVSIIWSLRLPRAILAFIVGAALSVSGAVMQSVLKNPLASSYTLGVSSGASLGAGLVILLGITIPNLNLFTLPVMGFIFGMGTILLAIAFASRLDGKMENNTIILIGMVFSLFANAITTLMSSLSKEHLQRLVFWQMGSFQMKDWPVVGVMLPITVVGIVFITHYNREMDIMTFGEEQAKALGVNLKRVKWMLLLASAALTGSAIAFVGVIGFVDLVAPHAVRKIFGSSHRLVIPMSAVCGGLFMVLSDLAARTVLSPQELPVGVVTSLIGAPFFAYIYFSKREKRKSK